MELQVRPSHSGTQTRYLRNGWYVAGWSDGLGEEPQARTFLDEPVALFRDGDGVAHAIGGRCPHRFASLGTGKVVDGALQCPYHGLRYDGTGACVLNPHEKGVVPRVAVQSYPLIERYNLLWIWMGDPARADAARIPDEFGFLADPAWEPVRGATIAEGHYELYSDNIMDLGHASFVHPALAANAWTVGQRRFRQEGDTVWSEYEHPNDYLSEGIGMIVGAQDRRMDTWVGIHWHAPAVMLLDFRVGEPGTPKQEMIALPSLHAFTPESEGRTHYTWAVARNFALGVEEFSAGMQGALEFAFEHEDMPIIREAHRLMGGRDFWDLQPIHLTGDAGGVRARRTLARLIAEERGEGLEVAAE